MTTTGRRSRVRSWFWWMAEPWRSVGFAAALVGSLALPAVVLSAGPMFRLAASDSIATRVVADVAPGADGLVVSGEGTFAPDVFHPLADELHRRFDQIDRLGTPILTMATDPIEVEQTLDSGRPAEVRVFAREGAIEALDVIEQAGDPHGGAWVSASFAHDTGSRLNDAIRISGVDVPIVGVYADLWASDLNDYWSEVPAAYVPRFARSFGTTDFELAIVDASTIDRLPVAGRVTWQVPLMAAPTTDASLRLLTGQYRQLERDASRPSTLFDAYRAFRSQPNQQLSFFTALYDAQAEATEVVDDLAQPVQTATVTGAAIGLALSTIGALFAVRRKRIEYRLLAADGDGWWQFFGRSLMQYALPAALGATLGVAVGYLTVSTIGPAQQASLAAIAWRDVALASVAACVLAGAVTAFSAIRLTEGLNRDVGRISGAWLLVSLGVAAAMWVQIGRDNTRDVNPLVVAFPFVGIVTGVAVSVAALRWLLQRARRTGGRLPTTWFLAWRALTGAQTSALLLTGAIGVSAGMAVLSMSFVSSADTATHDKAVTAVGSNTRLDLVGPPNDAELPRASTIVRSQTTVIGDQSVEVVAVDPQTFAAAVEWPQSFGGTATQLVDRLAGEAGMPVPAVLVSGGSVPDFGEIGRDVLVQYQLVGSIGSIALASSVYPTLVVRADTFDGFDSGSLTGTVDPDGPSPLFGFGYTIVSTASSTEVMRAVDAAHLRSDGLTTLGAQTSSVSSQSTRWAFDFLGILAAIGALASLGALTLYLNERRVEMAVATAMAMQMGLARATMTLATVVEMIVLVTASLAAGVASALVAASHVFPSFEPDPRVPPHAGAVIDAMAIAGVASIALVAVAAIAAIVQFRSSRAVTAEVLRG